MTIHLISPGELDRFGIVIDPYMGGEGAVATYSVGLGQYYSRVVGPAFKPGTDLDNVAPDVTHPATLPHISEWVNPLSDDHKKTMWQVFQSSHVKGLKSQFPDDDFSHLDSDLDSAIVLSPTETIVAHSEEFVGTPTGIVAMLTPSRYCLQRFIEVSPVLHAPGIIDRFVFTVKNVNPNQRMLLPTGMPIADVTFHQATETDRDDTIPSGPEKLIDRRGEWDPAVELVP